MYILCSTRVAPSTLTTAALLLLDGAVDYQEHVLLLWVVCGPYRPQLLLLSVFACLFRFIFAQRILEYRCRACRIQYDDMTLHCQKPVY